MCRLYGYRATHAAPVECELLEAQNALIRQSRADERGLSNPDGWGIGFVAGGRVERIRQAGPAFESKLFRAEARRVRATTLVAHVRRATVGGRGLANTHPFRHRSSLLAHNGHLGDFAALRPRLLEAMTPEWRCTIAGDTDSEHFFHLLLSRRQASPARPTAQILRSAIRDVLRWSGEADVAVNVLWTVGDELTGSRLGRSLWYVERDRPHVCEVHGTVHAGAPAGATLRTLVLASEPITGERWTEVPERSLFTVGREMRLRVEPL
ncbi:MAG: class II glutamine amidotransferase [Gemmatimonadota bacterium]